MKIHFEIVFKLVGEDNDDVFALEFYPEVQKEDRDYRKALYEKIGLVEKDGRIFATFPSKEYPGDLDDPPTNEQRAMLDQYISCQLASASLELVATKIETEVAKQWDSIKKRSNLSDADSELSKIIYKKTHAYEFRKVEASMCKPCGTPTCHVCLAALYETSPLDLFVKSIPYSSKSYNYNLHCHIRFSTDLDG